MRVVVRIIKSEEAFGFGFNLNHGSAIPVVPSFLVLLPFQSSPSSLHSWDETHPVFRVSSSNNNTIYILIISLIALMVPIFIRPTSTPVPNPNPMASEPPSVAQTSMATSPSPPKIATKLKKRNKSNHPRIMGLEMVRQIVDLVMRRNWWGKWGSCLLILEALGNGACWGLVCCRLWL
ncbi:uncharacterized protein HKW66_Vig0042290 [Vigna angularis]|uniref:Transmembrane protein n=1 Tax=Phaseolus angularis TaxID=3914 RepID=A0A8T0KZ62_PHAAN|nr:uncharacterized protein HKW66_Vig0042290 [Vigna angularis]